ncbi:MAG TPA: PilZ domain-containing protein [Pirellulales bacterium]|nr:PilZ domain-containing protein [Pirellulales bacterium]
MPIDSETCASRPVDRPPRYAPQGPQTVVVSVEWADGLGKATAAATLLDISAAGAKLSLEQQLKFNQAISISLTSAGGLDLSVSAKICWLKPGEAQRWIVGCVFVPELPPAAQQRLFSSGIVDRRTFSRRPVRRAAKAQWELDTTAFDIELHDVSAGGISLRSPRPGRVGTRMVIVATGADGGAVQVAVRVQWQIADDEGYLVGCAFVNVEGHSAMCEFVTNDQPGQTHRPVPRRRWRRPAFWTAVALLGWLAWRLDRSRLVDVVAAWFVRSAG